MMKRGDLWTTLRGKHDKILLIGGHIDSVPNGRWLDSCLNTPLEWKFCGAFNGQYRGRPPVTVRLVD
jgi:acetylornithine deacetylase/succinyl-diaminopimelate desuccinylase-like protein